MIDLNASSFAAIGFCNYKNQNIEGTIHLGQTDIYSVSVVVALNKEIEISFVRGTSFLV